MSEPAIKQSRSSLQKLREGARKLFIEEGYHNTRPQDIARVAGVANGTFYIHFADKKEAFLDFAEQAQAELLREYTHKLDGVSDHRERWKIICRTVIEFAGQNPGLLQAAFLDPVLIAPRDENAWQLYDRLGFFIEMVVDLQAPKQTVDYDTEMVSHAICGMLRHAMVYASRKEVDREKLVDDLSLFIDRGLGGL